MRSTTLPAHSWSKDQILHSSPRPLEAMTKGHREWTRSITRLAQIILRSVWSRRRPEDSNDSSNELRGKIKWHALQWRHSESAVKIISTFNDAIDVSRQSEQRDLFTTQREAQFWSQLDLLMWNPIQELQPADPLTRSFAWHLSCFEWTHKTRHRRISFHGQQERSMHRRLAWCATSDFLSQNP